MRIVSLALSLSLLLFSTVVEGEATLFFCKRLLVQVRKSLVDPTASSSLPTEYLRGRFGPDAYEKHSVREFEDDVERVYIALFDEELSQYFNWKWLSEKWGLGIEAAKILQAHYSLLVFDGHPVLKGKRASEVMALRSLLRHEFLKKNPEFRKKVDFYKERLGTRSVPQIAREMGVSEAQVYRETMEHGLSILDAFKGNFGEGKNEAQEFIRHHVGIEQRGESWSRILEWEGQKAEESGILIFLKDQGFTHQEIAEKLNGAKVILGDQEYKRTTQSVSQKLGALGYVQKQNRGEGDVAVFPYGLLKKSGVLIPEKVLQFYYDHLELSLEEMAAKLEVQQGSLRSFLQRHHFLERVSDSAKTKKSKLGRLEMKDLAFELPRLQREFKLIRDREDFEKAILSHLARTGRFPAKKSEFWTEDSSASRRKSLGIGIYAPGNSLASSALHTGRESAVEKIRAKYELTKVKFTSTEQGKIEKALDDEQEAARKEREAQEFEKLPVHEQQEIFENTILFHLADTGEFPSESSSFWTQDSPVSRPKALGIGSQYAPGKSLAATALNTGRESAIKKIRAKYELKKTDFTEFQLEKIKKALDDELEATRKERAAQEFEKLSIPEQRETFVKAILSHLGNTGEFPVESSSFWKKGSLVSRDKALGIGDKYGVGKVRASKALNTDRKSAIQNIRAQYELKKSDFTPDEQKKIEQALNEDL